MPCQHRVKSVKSFMSVSQPLLPLLLLLLLLLLDPAVGYGEHLLGLAMVHNGPQEVALVSANASSFGGFVGVGNVTAHTELAGMGDLCTVVGNIIYYLGDTGRGAILVGIDTRTGEEACSVAVPFHEVRFVGVGQTLDYDHVSDTLVLSGLVQDPTNSSHCTHKILRMSSPSTGTCDKRRFSRVGSFARDGAFFPIRHGSAVDGHGQKLFLGLSSSQTAGGIGVVDLRTGALEKVVPMANPGEGFIGMDWDAASQRLIGVASLTSGFDGAAYRTLDVKTGTWASTPLPPAFLAVGSNGGEMQAFDRATGTIYCTLYYTSPTRAPLLAAVQNGSVVKYGDVRLGSVGMCPPGNEAECLLLLAWAQ